MALERPDTLIKGYDDDDDEYIHRRGRDGRDGMTTQQDHYLWTHAKPHSVSHHLLQIIIGSHLKEPIAFWYVNKQQGRNLEFKSTLPTKTSIF